MTFGRLDNIETVDFSLPPTHPATIDLLQNSISNLPFQIYIGAPVMPDKQFIGVLFPKGTKEKDFFRLYAKHYNCLELNATHYNIPPLAWIQKWTEETPQGFKFYPKMLQRISHAANLLAQPQLVATFCETMAAFGEKLGTVFMQLPPHFRPSRQNELLAFAAQFPDNIPLSIEFRAEEWFADKKIWNDTCEALESLGVGTVLTDVAGRRDILHQRLTTPQAMIRFVCENGHPSDYQRLSAWAKTWVEWEKLGMKEAQMFIHASERSALIPLAFHFISEWNTLSSMHIQGFSGLSTQGSLF